MFLNKDRPLASMLQLGGIGLIAYDLIGSDAGAAGLPAAIGFAAFVIGVLLSKMRM
ncbi:MAG: hypothetical protein PVJ03_01725 [Chromatiaceae bacterium]